MQAPPPPPQGPLYVLSFSDGSIGVGGVGPPLRQHLKSFPPGHNPLTLSPLHWLAKIHFPLFPLEEQGISSQHLTSLGSLGPYPE